MQEFLFIEEINENLNLEKMIEKIENLNFYKQEKSGYKTQIEMIKKLIPFVKKIQKMDLYEKNYFYLSFLYFKSKKYCRKNFF